MSDKKDTGDEIAPVTEQQEAPKQQPPAGNATLEKAAQFLASHGSGDVSFTYEEERAVVRRIDRRVLVLLLWAYFFQQLDKSSLR